MMLLIRFNNGRVLQGVMLALGSQMVRVAIKGAEDAAEFRLINQTWVSEDCEPVTIEFVRESFSTEQRVEMPEPLVAGRRFQPLAERVM
jgi:hypothetical protein